MENRRLIDSRGMYFDNENGELTNIIYEGDTLKIINKNTGKVYYENIVNSTNDILSAIMECEDVLASMQVVTQK